MQVFVLGNPDFEPDALPVKIVKDLKKRLPKVEFVICDPNEEWQLLDKLIIIDSIVGIDKVMTFTSYKDFKTSPRLTLHDFDLQMKLKWLDKLKKLPPLLVIGLPQKIAKNEAVERVTKILKSI